MTGLTVHSPWDCFSSALDHSRMWIHPRYIRTWLSGLGSSLCARLLVLNCLSTHPCSCHDHAPTRTLIRLHFHNRGSFSHPSHPVRNPQMTLANVRVSLRHRDHELSKAPYSTSSDSRNRPVGLRRPFASARNHPGSKDSMVKLWGSWSGAGGAGGSPKQVRNGGPVTF